MKSNEKIAGKSQTHYTSKKIYIPKRFLSRNYSPNKYKNFLNNYYNTTKEELPINEIKINIDNKRVDKLNKPMISFEINKHKVKLKRTDSNSTTSINTNTDKIKRVTFSTVEIIRIKNFKRYNKLNSYTNEEIKYEKNNNNYLMDNCNVF